MKRTTHVLAFLLVGLVVVSAIGVAVAAAAPHTRTGHASRVDARNGAGVPLFKPAHLVVHSTTGKTPPKNVEFDGEPMGQLAASNRVTSEGAPGEVVISGVPGYTWRLGCGPAAVGMVVGYYDGHGWGELVSGDATSVTDAVKQMIASGATSGRVGHYEDYSLPKETTSAVLPDRSAAPAGDEHASDCIADFMHTSWSIEGLHYGESLRA